MSLFWKISVGLILLIAATISSLCFYFYSSLNRSYSNDASRNIVEIKSGEGTAEIARKLQDRGQISSDILFTVWAQFKKKPLQAGIYRIEADSSIRDVYDLISSGSTTHRRVTIPEGYRVEQIAQTLAKGGITEYEDFVAAAKPYEGKLFPDTYFLPLDISTRDIVAKMTDDYSDRISNLNVSDEDLIIASIVEREAVKDEERALIAGIYKNRIQRGMRLEADPTVQYGRDDIVLSKLSSADKKEFKFWQPISIKDYLTVISPHNAYIIDGLPPGPICNPGLKSIEATVNYQHHDYLYFLHKDGQIYPARTEAEHNANRAKILGANINNRSSSH